MSLTAVDNHNEQAVDWWFIYKLPNDIQPLSSQSGIKSGQSKSTDKSKSTESLQKNKTNGTEYLYRKSVVVAESLFNVLAYGKTFPRLNNIKNNHNYYEF